MSVFSDMKPRNKANRNGFDLGRYSTFSAKAGYILPVFAQPTLPSSEYSLDIKQLLRTQPLQKAAFAGFSINYDVIWCPYNHLYSSFNQFIAQRQCKNTTNQPSYMTIPVFNFGCFCEDLFYMGMYEYILSFCTDVPDGNDNPDVMSVKILIRDSHAYSESVVMNCIRMLDMFDYVNLLPLIKSVYAKIARAGVTYNVKLNPNDSETVEREIDWTHFQWISDPDASKVSVSQYLNSFGADIQRQIDNLGEFLMQWKTHFNIIKPMGTTLPLSSFFAGLKEYKPNIFAPLAYNKAFYEFYRNQYYDDAIDLYFFNGYNTESGHKRIPYVQTFNTDDWVNPTFNDLPFGDDLLRLLAIFNIKPHQYKKDLFTGTMPSTQFGDVSVVSTENIFAKLIGNNIISSSSLQDNQVVTTNYQGSPSSSYKTVNQSIASQTLLAQSDKFKFDPSPMISMLEFRKADAMQRFKERMMRAGDKVKDIFKAHGWSEPKSEKSYDPIFLGSFDGRLDINVVASTAEGNGVQLAQIAGNGMAVVNGSKVKIETSDFGVLMVLFHIEKDAIYDSYGIDLQHTYTEPFDYPYPELQNISLSPVPSEALNILLPSDQRTDIVGFLPRAIGYKVGVDKVHGEFYSALPYRYDGEAGEGVQRPSNHLPFVTGSFSDWVAPREDITRFSEKDFLYVNPHCVDTLFVESSNIRQESDQFLINARFDCYGVEPLPVIGLPI